MNVLLLKIVRKTVLINATKQSFLNGFVINSARPRRVNLGSAETETEMKISRDLGRDRDRDSVHKMYKITQPLNKNGIFKTIKIN